ncbi:MAG: helix-turn-helix domain-containing protein [Burkholderiales bacterium]
MTEQHDPQGAAEPPREESVGETLARARQSLGLSLEDCAQQLKLAPRKIEAMEQDRFDELPAGTFARGMLRSYAKLLGVDAEALIARGGEQMKGRDTTSSAVSLRPPIPFSEPGKRGNTLYVGLSIAALALVAWVAWGWQQERSAAKLSFVPASALPAPPSPPSQKGAVVATTASSFTPLQQQAAREEKPAAVAAEPAPATTEPAASEARPDAAAAVAATTATDSPAAATTSAEATAAAAATRRIELRFERESWVEIRGSNGRTLLVSQMHPGGTERVVEGEPPFALVIGNARHVRLAYDGKPVDLAPHIKVEVARLSLP